MIVKIFRVSTKEMYTFRNKIALFNFIQSVSEEPVFYNRTIAQLITYLPREEFCRIK